MATSTAPTLSPLSFPAATFAKLSPGPYLLAHLQPSDRKAPSTRPSGRAPLEHRHPSIHTGSLSHSNGSAVVRLGSTAIVCGIRAEILRAQDIPQPYRPYQTPSTTAPTSEPDDDSESSTEISDLSLLVPNLELSTGSSPSNLPGNPPSTLAQSLTHRLHSLLHSTSLLRPSDLRIASFVTDPDDTETQTLVTKAYWALYIDVLLISHDGNVFDGAWLAVLAALQDVRLPAASWDADTERVICDPRREQGRRLRLRGLPIAGSFGVFSTESKIRGEGGQEWVLADCDAFEEGVCRETITVVVGEEGEVRRVEKSGGGKVGMGRMREVVGEARKRAEEWRRVVVEARTE
ncbi:3' exoribonuclease family protein [Elsinoe australis]|uniref:Ribosomal RNA-processing protein 43 n=1 Tax=Elsinoe australis TaxID=40998 RepID=A0A4U7ASV5_9PEZI|nr:3' exoribonuclease family protein [Elsinoe australis]